MKKISALFLFGTLLLNGFSQTIPFNYDLDIVPITIPNFPGVHSFAHGQANGKWVIIGGRRDGVHARQPFNAFPEASNNIDIFVIDPSSQQLWSASVATLPTGIKEQLQSTNMNFHQDGDTLYILGGYGYSPTAVDHITYPNLTSINVSGLINAIVNGTSITSFFKQITDQNFAVTGGHLAMIADTFYLVGGHRFDGRYNPMGNPTYTQAYVDGIRKFTIDNSGSQLSYSNYSVITDQVHLHRRDYNLVPQIYPNGEEGYMISSGVFQIAVDLPFLYPVDIKATGYTPNTAFNQYLSNYHSPTIGIYDANANAMHSIFLGGMSQYYYSNGTLIQDNAVPFVKTLSRVSRDENGVLQEVVFPNELPALLGASAEYIPERTLPFSSNGVVLLSQITADSILVGHIVGGIFSPELNPFTANNTGVTNAHDGIYEVWLIKNETNSQQVVDGTNPFDVSVYPNPASKNITLTFNQPNDGRMNLYVTDLDGRIVWSHNYYTTPGQEIDINIKETGLAEGVYTFNFVYDGKFSQMKKVVIID